MEINDLNLKNLVSQPKNAKISEISSANLIGDLGKAKSDSLKKSITEVKDLIQDREKLSRQIIQECEKLKSEIDVYLRENQTVQIGGPDVIREKNDLRHKRIEISELQLNERLNCWKDTTQLKRELRELEAELLEKEERKSTLSKFLGE